MLIRFSSNKRETQWITARSIDVDWRRGLYWTRRTHHMWKWLRCWMDNALTNVWDLLPSLSSFFTMAIKIDTCVSSLCWASSATWTNERQRLTFHVNIKFLLVARSFICWMYAMDTGSSHSHFCDAHRVGPQQHVMFFWKNRTLDLGWLTLKTLDNLERKNQIFQRHVIFIPLLVSGWRVQCWVL